MQEEVQRADGEQLPASDMLTERTQLMNVWASLGKFYLVRTRRNTRISIVKAADGKSPVTACWNRSFLLSPVILHVPPQNQATTSPPPFPPSPRSSSLPVRRLSTYCFSLIISYLFWKQILLVRDRKVTRHVSFNLLSDRRLWAGQNALRNIVVWWTSCIKCLHVTSVRCSANEQSANDIRQCTC